MAENIGSRYGIMEKLNQQMIEAKAKLAEMIGLFDKKQYTVESEIIETKNVLDMSNKSYEHNHQVWKRDKEVTLKLLKARNARDEYALQEQIASVEATYKSDHEQWIATETAKLETTKKTFTRFKEEQTKKIDAQSETVAQIEQGIKDLKDMSAEQKEK